MRKVLFSECYMRSIVSACLAVFVFFFSCTQEDENITTSKEDSSDELIEFLVKTGFERDEIVLKDGVFIIGEDLLITKEEVEKYVTREGAEGTPEHYRGSYLISDTYVTNVKFYIDPSVPASWVTAIQGAVAQWNAVNGTKLSMSIVSSRTSANTVINTGYSTQNWVARAYLPSSSRRPGQSLTINTRFNTMDSGRKLFTIVHEMGHIIGLLHTNQTQGVFIEGTVQTDPNSVMNSFVLPWNGFTSGDIRAVQIIYPG